MTRPAAALTAFQITVAKLFFSLPQSDGFLLAGGAALAAQDLTSRPTRDLDLFTRVGGPSVPGVRDAFEAAVIGKGWTVRRIRDSETFCRLLVTGEEELLVDLAVDSPPNSPPSASSVGPTFGLEELAGRKVIALFDRAEARDFADVYVLALRYDPELLLQRAAEIDGGFDRGVFATMLGSLDRFTDSDIPVPPNSVTELRTFFRHWASQLRGPSAGNET